MCKLNSYHYSSEISQWAVQRNVNFGIFDSRPTLSRTSRELSTICLSAITRLQFTLITATSQAHFCNISSQLQMPIYPELQYQQGGNNWKTLTFTHQSSQVIPNACKRFYF